MSVLIYLSPPGGMRRRPHAVPVPVRAGDAHGGGRGPRAALRRARAHARRAHHARAAQGTLLYYSLYY